MNNQTYNTTMDKFQNYIDPMSKKLKELEQEGFNDQFKFILEKGLQSISTHATYQPGDLQIVNEFRFEGITDPADMSILYAIKTNDGKKGTLIDAYGTYSDSDLEDFLKSVEDKSRENL